MNRSNLHTGSLDLEVIRARLAQAQGQQFWRSLDDVADTPAFREFVQREFPSGASELLDPVSRRAFLKLMGASMALAGLTGCAVSPRQPQEQIAPYAQAPAEFRPGQTLYYATALALGGFGTGVLVESHDGRPTKIEGNPAHPASLGATDAIGQAEILSLYDPDRSTTLRRQGQINSWPVFTATLRPALEVQRSVEGAGLRILTGTVTSPTLAAQLQDLLTNFPQARWVQYDPVGRDNVRVGAALAFGEPVEPVYRFNQAQVVLALDADFMGMGPGRLRYARDFIDGRRVRDDQREMNRLYVVESTPTTTGIVADHRLRVRPSEVEAAARFIAQQLGIQAGQAAAVPAQETLAAIARDLRANPGAGLVLVGEGQPPVVHALAHAINAALNNVGATVDYLTPVEAAPVDQTAALAELVAEMRAGQVEMLVILDENPAFTAPADLGFAEALRGVRFSIDLSLYNDETAVLSTWHIPASHALEAWSDVRAFDGTTSIVQPLIMPLYDSRSAHEIIELINGGGRDGYAIVRDYWQNLVGEENFANFWGVALSTGVIAESAAAPAPVTLQTGFAAQAPAPAAAGLEISFRPDPMIWDGRYANNGWLQELPKPGTLLTWDNAALVSPRTAQERGLSNGDVVTLGYGGREVLAPIWITPGQADETVTVYLGHGRTNVGAVGVDTGFNAYALRTAAAPWFASGLTLNPTGQRYQLVTTQDHHSMERRDLIRVGEIERFRADPKSLKKEVYQEKYGKDAPDYESLLPEFAYTRNAWGMTIDLTACIGCNACSIACQAENNIPVVGKNEVAIGREMHWIRVDRYYAGADLDNPAIYVQPMTCMHCEKAPCEVVCPVAATVHDSEGINNMVYNRCVGTKYCSNNCPYKVRRFNFFQYADLNTPVLALMHNPDVTVRNRGVMEKCTFCIQRISRARIEAKKDGNRAIRDGEVVTACQQVCPTRAIIFGDLNDANSEVAQLKAQPHNYTLLDELNVQPRTSYLARLRNPNAEIEALAAAERRPA